MGKPAWRKLGATYLLARGKKKDELRDKIGREELLRLAQRSPNSLVKLAKECLSRVQHLPEFPYVWQWVQWKFKLPRLSPIEHGKARFVREFVKGSLVLAEE